MTVINDLISSSIFNVVELPTLMPVDSVVRYDTPQALTSGEQTQARDNIAAAAASDIASIVADIVDVDGRVAVIESDYVDTPELTAGLATKAALVHTHTASQISDSTTVGRTLLTAADAADQRTALGLGTIATYDAGDYLTPATAAATYLTISSATGTYLSITNAASTYLTILNASATYPTFSYVASNYSPLFDQSLNTTDSVAFADLNIGSSQFLVQPAFSTVSLTTGWSLAIQGGGLDTTLTWDGLAIGGTTGISLNALGAKITFPDATTLDTRPVQSHQANGSGFTTGGFNTVHYPHEVKVIAEDGNAYWVPARSV